MEAIKQGEAEQVEMDLDTSTIPLRKKKRKERELIREGTYRILLASLRKPLMDISNRRIIVNNSGEKRNFGVADEDGKMPKNIEWWESSQTSSHGSTTIRAMHIFKSSNSTAGHLASCRREAVVPPWFAPMKEMPAGW
ncbi:hypothetical protein ACH5RR_026428 [Cinchona calisaya]|uniref:Uncharacterized protein n=1 Tax=Cinchona calisaya TaxID=153742 RepID=A0ABD2Z2J5_9GENT